MRKELREVVLLAAIALTVYLVLAVSLMGLRAPVLQVLPIAPPALWAGGGGGIPFVGVSFTDHFANLFGALAILLGFRQTVGESVHGTYQFLLHLPLSRRRIIGCKLAVGTAVYLVVAAVPLVGYSVWAAVPGTHASPFAWSMTLTSWQAWWSMTMLYFAAFLCGLRAARWFGSRLLPQIAAVLPTFASVALSCQLASSQLAHELDVNAGRQRRVGGGHSLGFAHARLLVTGGVWNEAGTESEPSCWRSCWPWACC